MKYILVFLICSFAGLQAAAQHKLPVSNISKDTVGIFDEVEVEAQFNGGDSAWRNFLIHNLNIDRISDSIKFPKNKKIFKQTAIVKFIVCTDGSLCNIKTENKVNPLIKAEVERVLGLSPNWVPAVQNGRPVKAYRRQPITILIESE